MGANLQDHLQLRLIYKVAKPITTNDDLRTIAGRVRIGPAPQNLAIPPYNFTSDTKIKIG